MNLKFSIAHKEDSLSTQTWIPHKSRKPHQGMLGRAHKDLEMSVFVDGTSNLQRKEGKDFILIPQILAVGN
jgi:hypothetical protein